MKKFLHKVVLFAASIVALNMMFALSGCKKDQPDPPDLPDVEVPLAETTTVAGKVTDRNGEPVAGAFINTNGKTGSTDANGLFIIANVSSPERCYVSASKSGYFNGSTSAIARKNGFTQVAIRLVDDAPDFQINAASAQNVSLSDGSELGFTANSIASSSGGLYSGTVNVAVEHLSPDDVDFAFVAPGTDFRGISTTGAERQLYSYGMMMVKLTDDSGNELQIAAGNSAVVTMVVPSSELANAPGTIPLWHFNETSGLWEEEGSATLQGDKYVGTVTHFSTWNCDYPTGRSVLRGRVLDCNGNPLPGVKVKIGQTFAYTSSNGSYQTFIPSETSLNIQVSEPELGLQSLVVPIDPMAAGLEFTAPDLSVACPAYISGTLSCASAAVFSGLLSVTWAGGSTFIPVGLGNFTIAVPISINSATVNLIGLTQNVAQSVTVSLPGVAGEVTNAGIFNVCDNSTSGGFVSSFVINGDGFNNQTITLSGIGLLASATYGVSDNATVGFVSSTDGVLTIGFDGNSTGSFNSDNDNILASYSTGQLVYGPQTLQLTVTEYGIVGGAVKGTFSGEFIRVEVDPVTSEVTEFPVTISNGLFHFVRTMDQP